MAAHRCIYLDPAKGYHMCMLPVAPGGMLLCAKHRAEVELRYRERRDEAEDFWHRNGEEREP